MTLKLHFDWPNCVSSSSSEGDFLVIQFNDQSLFKDRDGHFVHPQFTLRKRIVRQRAISQNELKIMQILQDFI